MTTLSEKDLRLWLRLRFRPDELEWIEPTFGSRTGLPDVNINLLGDKLPVELKCWNETRRGVRHEVRPSQIRYHWLEHRAGRRSAFLVLVRSCNGPPRIVAFSGEHASPDPYPQDVSWMQYVCDYSGERKPSMKQTERERLLWLLQSDNFWS